MLIYGHQEVNFGRVLVMPLTLRGMRSLDLFSTEKLKRIILLKAFEYLNCGPTENSSSPMAQARFDRGSSFVASGKIVSVLEDSIELLGLELFLE